MLIFALPAFLCLPPCALLLQYSAVAKKLLEAKKAEKDAAKKVREDKIALEKAKKDAAKNAGVALAIGG